MLKSRALQGATRVKTKHQWSCVIRNAYVSQKPGLIPEHDSWRKPDAKNAYELRKKEHFQSVYFVQVDLNWIITFLWQAMLQIFSLKCENWNFSELFFSRLGFTKSSKSSTKTKRFTSGYFEKRKIVWNVGDWKFQLENNIFLKMGRQCQRAAISTPRT